jgi:D-arabinose 1-dehydrogenase-like Zn-dependent alcohol dehydrogenase
MLAYRLLKEKTQPEFQEVPEPHAGPGQVVIKSPARAFVIPTSSS